MASAAGQDDAPVASTSANKSVHNKPGRTDADGDADARSIVCPGDCVTDYAGDDDDDSASDAVSELAGLHVCITPPPPDTELGDDADDSHAHAGAAEAMAASNRPIKTTSMPAAALAPPARSKLAGQDLPPYVQVDWTMAPPDWRTDATGRIKRDGK